ncbi:ribosome small subunit-dependent GTPase A [soil metagenome]
MESLTAIGWTDAFAKTWQEPNQEGLQPARVVADFGTSVRIALPEIRTAEIAGKLAHYSERDDIPKVGDWVAVRVSDNGYSTVESVLPRASQFVRKVAGKRTLKQVIAANVDMAFVILALDADFSVERLKRYLYQLSSDNIKPIIVLNKADKTDIAEEYVEQLADLKLPIIVTSARNGMGVEAIRTFITPGRTAVLLGSSGVGKSTLTNQLLGAEIQQTQAVRASDSTGKHTTVHRELFVLPGGGLLIDTPGIRELQLWGSSEDLDQNFDDIIALAEQCKYTTCKHQAEVGCAVRQALQDGTLSAAHFANYTKMKQELVDLKVKTKVQKQSTNRRSYKNLKQHDKDTLQEMRDEIN